MFKVQTKDGPKAKWRDLKFSRPVATEADAWALVGRLDQDGYIDRARFRVVPA